MEALGIISFDTANCAQKVVHEAVDESGSDQDEAGDVEDEEEDALSGGAIAGIVVGSIVSLIIVNAVILIALVIGCFGFTAFSGGCLGLIKLIKNRRPSLKKS
jgi:uncharacterized membrane protein YebE (DUF533 family)